MTVACGKQPERSPGDVEVACFPSSGASSGRSDNHPETSRNIRFGDAQVAAAASAEFGVKARGNKASRMSPAAGTGGKDPLGLEAGNNKGVIERKRNCCTAEVLKSHVPLFNIPDKYTCRDFWADFLAGILTGIPCIPQGIIYAEICNLPLEYGLYAGFMGPFIYAIFGTIKEMHVGPVAAVALLVGSVTSLTSRSFAIVYATLLCFTFGIFSFLVGALRLGWIVDLVPVPVTSGLVSAAAITVMVCNIKTFLGLSDIKFQQLYLLVPEMCRNLHRVVYGDLIMGICSVIALNLMQDSIQIRWEKYVPIKFVSKFLNITFATISLGRTPLLTTICGYIAYFLNRNRPQQIVTTAKAVDVLGIPAPSIPAFSIPARNVTINGSIVEQPAMGYFDIITYGGSEPFVLILIICLVQQALISRNFAKAEPVNVNHELRSLGLIQVLSSFFGSMPVTGAFIRSAGMAAQGVRTRFGVIWAGLMVLFALHVLTPYVEYDPKPSLSAIVFCAVYNLIQRDDMLRIWRTKKQDMFPFLVTFVPSLLFGLKLGFCLGVVANVAVVLLVGADPKIDVFELDDVPLLLPVANPPAEDKGACGPGSVARGGRRRRVVVMRPDRLLHFSGVETFRELMCHTAAEHIDSYRQSIGPARKLSIVIDCLYVAEMDYTAAKRLGSTARHLKTISDVDVVFVNVRDVVDTALNGATDGNVKTFKIGCELSSFLSHEYLLNLERSFERSQSALDNSAFNQDTFSGEEEEGSRMAVVVVPSSDSLGNSTQTISNPKNTNTPNLRSNEDLKGREPVTSRRNEDSGGSTLPETNKDAPGSVETWTRF